MKTVLHTLAMVLGGLIYGFGFLFGIVHSFFCEGMLDSEDALDDMISYINDEDEK